MKTGGSSCPNCGREMDHYRTETQSRVARAVQLRWCICPGCRHISLDRWAWIDERPATAQFAVE